MRGVCRCEWQRYSGRGSGNFSQLAVFPSRRRSAPCGRCFQPYSGGAARWVGAVVVAPLCAVAAHSTAHRKRTADDRGVIGYAGPIQDVVLAFLMAVLALALPLLLIASVSIGVAFTVGGVVLVWGGWGAWLPITFNKRYLDLRVAEYRQTGTAYPPDLIALEKHLRWQNLVAGVLRRTALGVRIGQHVVGEPKTPHGGAASAKSWPRGFRRLRPGSRSGVRCRGA